MEAICDWDDLQLTWTETVSRSNPTGLRTGRFPSWRPSSKRTNSASRSESSKTVSSKSVTLFAYPYGDPGTDPAGVSERLLEAGYRGPARTTTASITGRCMSRIRLSRLTMGPDTDLEGLLAGL